MYKHIGSLTQLNQAIKHSENSHKYFISESDMQLIRQTKIADKIKFLDGLMKNENLFFIVFSEIAISMINKIKLDPIGYIFIDSITNYCLFLASLDRSKIRKKTDHQIFQPSIHPDEIITELCNALYSSMFISNIPRSSIGLLLQYATLHHQKSKTLVLLDILNKQIDKHDVVEPILITIDNLLKNKQLDSLKEFIDLLYPHNCHLFVTSLSPQLDNTYGLLSLLLSHKYTYPIFEHILLKFETDRAELFNILSKYKELKETDDPFIKKWIICAWDCFDRGDIDSLARHLANIPLAMPEHLNQSSDFEQIRAIIREVITQYNTSYSQTEINMLNIIITMQHNQLNEKIMLSLFKHSETYAHQLLSELIYYQLDRSVIRLIDYFINGLGLAATHELFMSYGSKLLLQCTQRIGNETASGKIINYLFDIIDKLHRAGYDVHSYAVNPSELHIKPHYKLSQSEIDEAFKPITPVTKNTSLQFHQMSRSSSPSDQSSRQKKT
ncbi:MAG: hypothetical protein FJ161_01305 [Gammaproteobacteria bacterium]|nr:hypothetical protein [Gammaproteobacteria bacterium]